MPPNDWLMLLLGEKGHAVLAGAAGGLVRWLTLRSGFWDGIASITVGAVCAVYLGPLAQPAIDAVFGQVVVDEASRASFSGFIIGLGGVSVTGLVMDIWDMSRRRARIRRRREHDDEEDEDG